MGRVGRGIPGRDYWGPEAQLGEEDSSAWVGDGRAHILGGARRGATEGLTGLNYGDPRGWQLRWTLYRPDLIPHHLCAFFLHSFVQHIFTLCYIRAKARETGAQ